MQIMLDALFSGESYDSLYEVGCASGWYLTHARPDVIRGGIDIDESNIAVVKKKFPRDAHNFIHFDGRKANWPVQDKSYDIVFTVGTLLIMPDPLNAMREMLRIAKKKIIIAELHRIGADMSNGYVDAFPKDVRDIRITRDYVEAFKLLRLQPQITDEVLGKTIFKCTV